MEKRYKYEFDGWSNWERLTDTVTGQTITRHLGLEIYEIFSLLGIDEQLEIKEAEPDEIKEDDLPSDC